MEALGLAAWMVILQLGGLGCCQLGADCHAGIGMDEDADDWR